MKQLNAFTYVSVDGFFAGPHGEIDWFKDLQNDPEYEAFTHGQASGGGALLFGHTTYEMMKSFWPTPEAEKTEPQMAKAMRNSAKIVVSKKLTSAPDARNWKNVTLWHDLDPAKIRELKNRERNGITILGSGSIVQQLANLRLIDEFHLVVVPHVLGSGKRLFEDVKDTRLKLLEAKSFRNGIAWLSYRQA